MLTSAPEASASWTQQAASAWAAGPGAWAQAGPSGAAAGTAAEDDFVESFRRALRGGRVPLPPPCSRAPACLGCDACGIVHRAAADWAHEHCARADGSWVAKATWRRLLQSDRQLWDQCCAAAASQHQAPPSPTAPPPPTAQPPVDDFTRRLRVAEELAPLLDAVLGRGIEASLLFLLDLPKDLRKNMSHLGGVRIAGMPRFAALQMAPWPEAPWNGMLADPGNTVYFVVAHGMAPQAVQGLGEETAADLLEAVLGCGWAAPALPELRKARARIEDQVASVLASTWPAGLDLRPLAEGGFEPQPCRLCRGPMCSRRRYPTSAGAVVAARLHRCN